MAYWRIPKIKITRSPITRALLPFGSISQIRRLFFGLLVVTLLGILVPILAAHRKHRRI